MVAYSLCYVFLSRLRGRSSQTTKKKKKRRRRLPPTSAAAAPAHPATVSTLVLAPTPRPPLPHSGSSSDLAAARILAEDNDEDDLEHERGFLPYVALAIESESSLKPDSRACMGVASS